MVRAEKFAAKNDGRINRDSNGKIISVTTTSGQVHADGNGMDVTVNTYKNFGDFSSFRNFGNTLIGFDKALSGSSDGFNTGGSYGGLDGMRKFSEEANNFGDALEDAGMAASATGAGVVAGAPMILAGEIITGYATTLDIIADISEIKFQNVGIKTIGEGVQGALGKQIKKSRVGKAVEFGTKLVTKKTVDKVVEENTTDIHGR